MQGCCQGALFTSCHQQRSPQARGTTLKQDARLDISCRGYFSALDKAFIDVRVLHSDSQSIAEKPLLTVKNIEQWTSGPLAYWSPRRLKFTLKSHITADDLFTFFFSCGKGEKVNILLFVVLLLNLNLLGQVA